MQSGICLVPSQNGKEDPSSSLFGQKWAQKSLVYAGSLVGVFDEDYIATPEEAVAFRRDRLSCQRAPLVREAENVRSENRECV